jgi:hypothetical protein
MHNALDIRIGDKTPGEGSSKLWVRLATKPRVPHISLVFREMWGTRNLDRRLSMERTKTHG